MIVNFWLERPPFAITGILKELKNKGIIINLFIKNGQNSSRNNIDSFVDNIFNIINYDSTDEVVNNIDIIKSGINIINGFRSQAFPFLCSVKKKEKIVIGCMTEQLNPLGKFKFIKSLLLKVKYFFIILRLQKNIDFLLPIGDEARLFFKKLGWKKSSHSIYYIPDLNYSSNLLNTNNEPSVFCYIGRNDYVDKGLDLAVNYFVKHTDKNLLIIGNYGNNSKEVLDIIERCNNIKRIDSISPNQIINFCIHNGIKCIVVPSKSDGWNPNVYISLLSAIPCLCSTKTGNCSLVLDNQAGIVFKPNMKSFEKAMAEFDSLSSEDINNMRNNAKKYALDNSPNKQCDKLLDFLYQLGLAA